MSEGILDLFISGCGKYKPLKECDLKIKQNSYDSGFTQAFIDSHADEDYV